jgi:hypothetical protein
MGFSFHHRVQTGSVAYPASWPKGAGNLSPGLSGRGVKFTTQLYLVPRLRLRGAIRPLPIRLHGVVLN